MEKYMKTLKFNKQMKPLVLDGSKTQTRRLLDLPKTYKESDYGPCDDTLIQWSLASKPESYGENEYAFIDMAFPTDTYPTYAKTKYSVGDIFEVDGKQFEVIRSWIEQVQDISQEDAKAEGVISFVDQGRRWHRNYVTGGDFYGYGEYKDSFQSLWNSIYPGTWDKNIWVECIEFKSYRKA